MSRFKAFSGLFLMVMLLTNCYSVHLVAPSDQEVKLATKHEPLPFKETQRNWYILWGLVPITNNATDEVIQKNGLKNVRVETKYEFVDALISGILSFVSVTTNTTVIEGSTGSK